MTTVVVNSSTQLLAALKSATAGETIDLASGIYSNFNISNIHTPGNVTITSQNASSLTVISSMGVVNSSGINFTNINFSESNGVYPVQIRNSNNINFSGDNFRSASGVMDMTQITTGLMINNSSNVSVTNSNFTLLENGISEGSNSNILISGNSFHNMMGDGIDNAAVSNVTISNNSFTNFDPSGLVHPDAIQFWTTGTTSDSSNINITGNVITRGSGSAVQGIFLTDQVGTMHYDNVNISGNTIIGESYNGITLQDSMTATITDNTVLGYTGLLSWIRLENDHGIAATHNNVNSFCLISQPGSLFTSAMGNGTDLAAVSYHTTNITGLDASTVVSSSNSDLRGTQVTSLVLAGSGNLSVIANNLNDRIIANAGNDTLIAGTGAVTFTEGAGTDTFVFSGQHSAAVITNFGQNGLHDVIDISSYLSVGLHPTLHTSGANTVISFSSGASITLDNVAVSQLHATAAGYSF